MKKLINTIILCTMLMLVLTIPVSAAEQMNLPDSFLIGDSAGINVGVDGTYYIEAKDLLPGDTIEKKLVIQNLASGNEVRRLFLSANPMEQTGPIELLKALQIDIQLNGQTIYKGAIYGSDGNGMIDNALDLGTYTSGQQGVLTFWIQLDPTLSLNLFYEKSVAEISWKFYAMNDEKATPPKTGQILQTVLYLAIGAIVLGASILLAVVIKRRKAKQIAR
jgi:hypothetical protein